MAKSTVLELRGRQLPTDFMYADESKLCSTHLWKYYVSSFTMRAAPLESSASAGPTTTEMLQLIESDLSKTAAELSCAEGEADVAHTNITQGAREEVSG